MPYNFTTWYLQLYFPSEGKCVVDFYRPLNIIASAGFELATLGPSGKHTNHYTKEAPCGWCKVKITAYKNRWEQPVGRMTELDIYFRTKSIRPGPPLWSSG
jgi:hypothetical protein